MRKNLNAQKILEKTLEMIIRYDGASRINLRKIAKELECAHTNIYNYYSSYDDLLWNATAVAMKRMSEYIFSENTIESFVRKYVDFAFKNKGLYKLIWYERINSRMPDCILETIKFPGIRAAEICAQELGVKIEDVRKRVGIGLAYTHGELTIYLNNRAMITQDQIASYKERINQNALEILFNHQKNSGGTK